MNADYSENLKKNFQTASVLYYAISLAVVFYAGLAYFLIEKAGLSFPLNLPAETTRWIFLVLAGGGLMFTGKLKESLLSAQSNEKASPQTLIAKLLRTDIIACGFCELPALLGLIQALLASNFGEFYLFGFVSFAGLANNIPKYERWEMYVRHNYLP